MRSLWRSRRRTYGPSPDGADTGHPRERAEGLGRPDDPVGRAAADDLAQVASEGAAYVLARRPDVLRAGRVVGQPVPGHPAGAQRHRERGVRLLLATDRHLEGAAADVEDEQPPGGPAVPAPDGEERQPRLVLAGEDLERRAGLALDLGDDLLAVGCLANR